MPQLIRIATPASPAQRGSRKAQWLGLTAGLLARWSRSALPPVSSADLRQRDYSANTQRLGIRFTERIRNAFRQRWIREIF